MLILTAIHNRRVWVIFASNIIDVCTFILYPLEYYPTPVACLSLAMSPASGFHVILRVCEIRVLNESGLRGSSFNSLRPRQNRHFEDDILTCIFLNENVWIPIKISMKFVPQGPIKIMVQIMVWRRPGDKPLSGPMMVRLPTHTCVTRPQWVKLSNAVWTFYAPC